VLRRCVHQARIFWTKRLYKTGSCRPCAGAGQATRAQATRAWATGLMPAWAGHKGLGYRPFDPCRTETSVGFMTASKTPTRSAAEAKTARQTRTHAKRGNKGKHSASVTPDSRNFRLIHALKVLPHAFFVSPRGTASRLGSDRFAQGRRQFGKPGRLSKSSAHGQCALGGIACAAIA